MIKIKFFQSDVYLMRDLVLSKINAKNYNDEDGFGFVLIEESPEFCKVQYVEKNIIERQIETPLGGVNIIQEIAYYKFQFILRYNSLKSILFVNPPRNIKYASDIIRGLIPEETHVSQIDIDLKDKIEDLKNNFKGKLKSVTLSNIVYDNETQAKTKLNSINDLYGFYHDNFKKTFAKVDAATFDISGRVYELTSSGRVVFQGGDIEAVFDII